MGAFGLGLTCYLPAPEMAALRERRVAMLTGSDPPEHFIRSAAEVDLFVSQTDVATIGQHNDLVMEGVINIGQPL